MFLRLGLVQLVTINFHFVLESESIRFEAVLGAMKKSAFQSFVDFFFLFSFLLPKKKEKGQRL